MPFRLYRYPGLSILLLIFLLSGCASGSTLPARLATSSLSATPNATATMLAGTTSFAHFTFSGGQSGVYTLQTSVLDSELRHGHREFTILLNDADISLFIVFYGYQGPGNYTLVDTLNGGDVHIGLQDNTLSWDLLMQPAASCALSVTSDIPLGNTGVDRMKGSFRCPLLLSSSPDHPQQAVTVSDGSFDIAMLVAS